MQKVNWPEPTWRNTPASFLYYYLRINFSDSSVAFWPLFAPFVMSGQYLWHSAPRIWSPSSAKTKLLAMQGTNGHRIYVSRMSKYLYSAENKVNFVLWTQKTKTSHMIENVFWTGQRRDDLCFFFLVSRVKSKNSCLERLIRATHLHIRAITRAVLGVYKRFTKPVTLD